MSCVFLFLAGLSKLLGELDNLVLKFFIALSFVFCFGLKLLYGGCKISLQLFEGGFFGAGFSLDQFLLVFQPLVTKHFLFDLMLKGFCCLLKSGALKQTKTNPGRGLVITTIIAG